MEYSRVKWQSPYCTSCAASAFGHPVQQREWEHVIKHAPYGWKEQYGLESQNDDAEIEGICSIDEVEHKKSKTSWARLIAKIYEFAPMICTEYGSEMRVISVITSEYEIRKILRHLLKTGKSPPCVSEDV